MPVVFRSLRRGFWSSSAVIAMLALAIGANTAIYSVAKAVVFAPLPFPKPDRLVHVFETGIGGRFQPGGSNMISVRPGVFQDWREQAHSFASMAAAQYTRATVMAGDRARVANAFLAGEDFFETMGVPARLGRTFSAGDYADEGARVVVLADRVWRERYGADPSIIGREIVVNGAAHRVVGVMPPAFLPTGRGTDPEVWLPLIWTSATKHSMVLWGNYVYARLKDGVTLAQAQTEMEGVAARMRAAKPDDYAFSALVAPLDQYLFGSHEKLFVLLLGAVGLVLLIACANVASLMLARALERQREFAVRSALGASRAAILRQMLAESLVIAGAGGLAGVALSPLLTGPALALLPAASGVPRLDQVHLDPAVLLFSLLISMAAGLLFGIFPAIRAARGDLSTVLNSRGRGTSLGRHEGLLSDALVMAEIALSLVLLVGGGLLTRAFLTLLQTDPGFRPAQAVALQLSIPVDHYGPYEVGGKNTARQHLFERMEQTVQSLTGVQTAGMGGKLPLRQFWNPWGVSISGRPPAVDRNGVPMISKHWGMPMHGDVSTQNVSPGYFGALGIPLVRGRLFDNRDRAGAPMVAVVNQAMVRKFFPAADPIGRRIAIDMTSYAPQATIVGVVGDCRLDAMNARALPEVFWPMSQLPSADAWLVVRARGDAGPIADELRQAVRRLDPEIGIAESTTMTSVVGDSLWRERFSALLVGLFSALAVLIAAGGIYAVISHAVERRTHELGVRVAIGASGGQIARTVLGHGLRVTLIGVAFGALLTLTAGRAVAQQTYHAGDVPWMLVAVVGLLLALTLLACWVPLRKALAVDPATVLRLE